MTATWQKTLPDYVLCIYRTIYDHCNHIKAPSLICAHPDSCPLSEHPDCPFCNLQRLTPWYLCDTENDIVVCKDLQPKQYSYRILVVGLGQGWHVPYKNLPSTKQHLLVQLVEAIARHHIATGLARDFIKTDFVHSYPDHAHLQACMWTSQDHRKFAKDNSELQQFVGQDPNL